MAEEVALSIKVNAEQANQSVGSFKKQLREATADLVNMSMKFGEASAQAQAAAKKVAGLKDSIGDAKALADTFNPDKKFVALGGALQGAVAGFSALQGGMALFGGESKDVEKALLKVQSAMALQQGISGVFGALDSFKNLGNEIKGGVVKAFTTLRGAIIATGLGALAVGIGLLIANFEKVKQVVLNFIPGLAKVGEFVGKLINKVTDFIGVTSEAQRAQERFIASSEKQLKAAKDFLDQEGYKYDEFTKRKIQADIDYKTKKLEIDKDTTMSEAEKNKALKNYSDKRDFEIVEADKERNKKIQDATDESNKKLREKQDAAHKQRLEKEKENAKEIASLIANLTDERNKIRLSEFDYQVSLLDKEREARLKQAAGNDELIKLIEQNYYLKLNQLREKDKGEEKQAEEEKKTVVLDANKLITTQIPALRQQNTEFFKADNKIRLGLAQTEIEAALAVADTLGNLSKLIGEQTGAGKALAVAQATISTFVSAQKAYEASIGIPFVGPVLAPINAALAVAAGVANIKKILAVQVPGGKGGGGSIPTASTAATAQRAPVTPQAQTTRIDQGQINQIGNAAVRAYVVETEVNSQQERRTRIERAARIG
jgi:hypothetical protein